MKNNETNLDRACGICHKILGKRHKKFCSATCAGKYKSEKYKGRKHSEEAIQKMRGRKLSLETKEKQNLAKRREKIRIEGNFPCQKCDKIFNSNTALRAHKSYCNTLQEKLELNCEQCNKSFSTTRSLKIHTSNKHVSEEKRLEKSRKMIEIRANHPYRLESHAEISFYENIKKIFDDAIRSYQINGLGHVYDIFIPSENIIIEFDGDYWHGNPKKYELTNRMKQQFFIDKAHNDTACKSGIGIVRVWHSESETFIQELRSDKTCLKLKLLK